MSADVIRSTGPPGNAQGRPADTRRPDHADEHPSTPKDTLNANVQQANDNEAAPRACMVGFAQVPAEMLTAQLTANALGLWAVLDIHQRDNPDTWPSRSHLAEDLSCSPDAVDRAVTALEAAGFLAVDRRGGRGRTNRYQLLGRPRDIHNGRSSAALSVDHDARNGRTDAAVSTERAAEVRTKKAAEMRPRSRSRETEASTHSGLSTTDRAREATRAHCPTHMQDMPCISCAGDRKAGEAA